MVRIFPKYEEGYSKIGSNCGEANGKNRSIISHFSWSFLIF